MTRIAIQSVYERTVAYVSKIEIKKQEKKQRLLDAALELFLEQGFHNTRIEDISKAAVVGKGTFYLHFKNKNDLVRELLELFFAELLEILQWVGAQTFNHPEQDLFVIFQTESEALVSTLQKHRRLARFCFQAGPSISPETAEHIQGFMNMLSQVTSSYFERAMNQNKINTQLNPTMLSLVVIGGITFTYQQWVLGHIDEEPKSLVAGLYNVYQSILAPKIQ